MLKNIPKIWQNAYGIICLWYFVNVFVSSFTTYYLFNPREEEFLHAVAVFTFYAFYILIAWIWSNFMFGRSITLQVIGQFLGLLFGFLGVSYLFFELSIFFDNRTADDFQTYIIHSFSGTEISGKMDAFRIFNEYAAIIFIAYVIKYSQYLSKREREKAQLQVKNKDMQLTLLKSQINPHFLFNTLNSISMLVSVSKEKARKVISQLSNIIRYTLETGEENLVPLTQELKFIDDYLNIQLVRFEGHFEVIKEIDETCLGMDIPPMILQPMIENSIKYGVGQLEGNGKIWIRIQSERKRIRFEVSDNGLGINAKQKVMSGQNSTGIGMKNTNARLQNIYGESSKLEVDANENGYSVVFYIPKSI